MKKDTWDEVIGKITVRGKTHPVSEVELDEFERQAHCKLPESYRLFCRRLGPGSIGDRFSIAVPGYTGKYSNKYDLRAKTEFYHRGLEWKEYASHPEQFERAIIFGDDGTGAVYFWDPTEVTDKKSSEYAVYAVFRDWKRERLSDAFFEFVRICFHFGDGKLYDEPPKLEFVAAIGWKDGNRGRR